MQAIRANRQFWLSWTLATAGGVLITNLTLAFGKWLLLIFGFDFRTLADLESYQNYTPSYLEGVLMGAGVGLAQWLVLRTRLNSAYWWVPATAFGWWMAIITDHFYLVPGLLGGFWVGILQWLVLRSLLRPAIWWILAATVAWSFAQNLTCQVTVALPLEIITRVSLKFSTESSILETIFMNQIFMLTVAGITGGAGTGLAMVWLLHNSLRR